MSSSGPAKAVYIPPAKRRQRQQQKQQQEKERDEEEIGKAVGRGSKGKQPRFHGAFTGGFSAGYFNTVDTKKGWTPSSKLRQDQQISDFMDEQDHEEWGGPTNVTNDYKQQNDKVEKSQSTTTIGKVAAPLESLFKVSHQTVGPRLLRLLGYREETGSAFVPSNNGTSVVEHSNTTADDLNTDLKEDNSLHITLSKRRLRQIRLQSSKIVLPAPKLDQCGLGFEAHENAPEFQRYREQRQQRAQQRARGQTNVYRLSHLAPLDKEGNAAQPDSLPHASAEYMSYETPEDFVGTKSAAGFSLRDDEDDAYDNTLPTVSKTGLERNPKLTKSQMLGDEYTDQIYDPDDDSDVDDSNMLTGKTRTFDSKKSKTGGNIDLFGGALASWASGTSASSSKEKATHPVSTGLTSSGQPPLAGFQMGGSMELHKKRFPGPDLPRDFQLQRHVFGPNEQPAIFQTIARAIQIEEQQTQRNIDNQLHEVSEAQPKRALLAGNQFSSLAMAMKNRFTSGSTTIDPATPQNIGLHWPRPVRGNNQDTEKTLDASSVDVLTGRNSQQEIKVQRTTQTFIPHPLVCKRFGVPVPQNGSASAAATTERMTEASYFEKEILATAQNQPSKEGMESDVTMDSKQVAIIVPSQKNVPRIASSPRGDFEENEETLPSGIIRPSMDTLKSIFEPHSADESSENDTDLDSIEEKEQEMAPAETTKGKSSIEPGNTSISISASNVDKSPPGTNEKNELVKYQSSDEKGFNSGDEESSSSSSYRRERKRKHRKKHKERKRSRSSKSSRDPIARGGSSSSEDDKERRRAKKKDRKSKDSKKRRKKEPSSHRRR